MNAYNHETSPLNTPTAETAKILVIRFGSIENVLFSSCLCNSLKKTFPKAQIDYISNEEHAETFANHHYIDTFIGFSTSDYKNPWNYWNRVKQIAARGYDLVVDAESSFKTALISLFARERAICIGRANKACGFFYTNKVAATPFCANKVNEQLRLLDPLVAMGFDVKYETFSLLVPLSLKNEARLELESEGVDFKRPVFFASLANRQLAWEASKIQAWADHALEAYNAQIVLTTQAETQDTELTNVYRVLDDHPDIYLLQQNISPTKITAIMSHCDLYFGNDCTAQYIAQACGLPSASVFPPTISKPQWTNDLATLHQGVEWQDVSALDSTQLKSIDECLQSGSAKERLALNKELYNNIDVYHAAEVLDSVASAAGIPYCRKLSA